MTSNTVSKPPALPWQVHMMRFGFRSMGSVMPELTGRMALRLFGTPQSRHISRRTQTIMSQAEAITIPHGHGKLAGYVWDAESAEVVKGAILLVHGWENSASHLANFVPPLLEQGFKVVAIDGPAHGKSSGTHTNLIDFSQGIQAAVGQLGPFYGIIAHSFGGAATAFTLHQNQQISVEKVVLMGTPSRLSDVLDRFASFIHLPERGLQAMGQTIFNRFGFPVDSMSVELGVTEFSARGLVVHDKQDDVVPFSDAEAIAQAWPQGQLLATDGLGHRRILRDPEVIRQVIDFLVA